MSIKETKENIEQNVDAFFEKQLDRVNSWLSFAEAKNAGLVAANVAILAVVIQLFDEAKIICVVAGITTLISCTLCLVSFLPVYKAEMLNLIKDTFNSAKDYNLLFYKDIAEVDKFSRYMELVNKKYFNGRAVFSKKSEDLAFEIMENCKITMHKYKWFSMALKVDLVAMICIAATFIAA